MTKEELITKTNNYITEGFAQVIQKAYNEGYHQGYADGKTNQIIHCNSTRLRVFDFGLPSNTLWAVYENDTDIIYSYKESQDLKLKMPTKKQIEELQTLKFFNIQGDNLHLHIVDNSKQTHRICRLWITQTYQPFQHNGFALWWHQIPNENNEIEAFVLQNVEEIKSHNHTDYVCELKLTTININDKYLTMFVLPVC